MLSDKVKHSIKQVAQDTIVQQKVIGFLFENVKCHRDETDVWEHLYDVNEEVGQQLFGREQDEDDFDLFPEEEECVYDAGFEATQMLLDEVKKNLERKAKL